MERTTPLKHASRKPKPPLGSDFTPRVLATKSWNAVDEEESVEGVDGSTGEQVVEEEVEQKDSTQLFQELLLSSQKAHEQLAKKSRASTDLEKGRPKTTEITAALWIVHRVRFKAYKDEDGVESLYQSFDIDLREYIAEDLLNITLDEMKDLTDEELSEQLNNYYRLEKGSGYLTVLSNLSMVKTTKFSRDAIEKYASVFMRTIKRNPNFSDPKKGGAHPEVINEIFISGIQPPDFVLAMERHRTKTAKDTQQALASAIPLFEEMVNQGGYNPVVKPAPKIANTMLFQRSPTTSPGTRNCPHCERPGHGYRDCPSKDQCLRCKTKAHKYWDFGTCLYRKTVIDGYKGGKQAKAMAARLTSDEKDARIAELEAQLKVKHKKSIILDSGANITVISDITHVDNNTVPSCRRAEDAAGVETADGAIMPITGNGVVVGLEGPICDGASTTLVSVSQFCQERNAMLCFNSTSAVAFER